MHPIESKVKMWETQLHREKELNCHNLHRKTMEERDREPNCPWKEAGGWHCCYWDQPTPHTTLSTSPAPPHACVAVPRRQQWHCALLQVRIFRICFIWTQRKCVCVSVCVHIHFFRRGRGPCSSSPKTLACH